MCADFRYHKHTRTPQFARLPLTRTPNVLTRSHQHIVTCRRPKYWRHTRRVFVQRVRIERVKYICIWLNVCLFGFRPPRSISICCGWGYGSRPGPQLERKFNKTVSRFVWFVRSTSHSIIAVAPCRPCALENLIFSESFNFY